MIESKIIQGLMRIDKLTPQELLNLIKFDLEHGINFFDTSNIYGNGLSEKLIGEAIKLEPTIRDKMIIQSKCGIYFDENNSSYYDLSKERIIKSCYESLERLNTSYLDYFLLHRPDIFVDNKEVAEAINFLVKEKKILHFGVSNFSKELIDYLSIEAKQKIEVNQLQLGLGHLNLVSDVFNLNTNLNIINNNDLYFYLRKNNIKIQCWSPFLYGMFEGNILNNDKFTKLNNELDILSKKYNTNKSTIALSFLLNLNDDIAIVIGSLNTNHILDAIKAIEIKLTKIEWYRLYKSVNVLP